MKRIFLTTIFFVYFSTFIYAAKEPMKYGKPETSELEMTVYAPDSSASAVVLCNYGYFNANEFQFSHTMRIKILKESGKSQGNFFVPASEKTNVRGQVVNMEGGKPVISKLTKDGIFIERVTGDIFRARVAFPNVKVGSVIDVEFFYNGIPNYWEFQKTIPIKWSELIMEESMYITLRRNFTGYIPFAAISSDRWVTSNVPAFQPESYINNYENYISRMQIELESIHIPGVLYKDYATSWDAVVKTLQTHNNFGFQLSSPNLYLNSLEHEIKKATTDPYQRMEKAFEAMKKFKWNNKSSIWPSSEGISYVYNKKTGNSADVNMSLIILLRKLDIRANPVLLSTRDNGFLPPHSVSIDKLNYMIVKAYLNDTTYLLDATEENMPIDMIPERALNGRGLEVPKESFFWEDITPKKKDRQVEIFNGSINQDGSIKGNWMISYVDYAAFDKRENFKSFNSEDEYLKSIESSYNGLTIDSYKNQMLDSLNKPFTENIQVSLKNRMTKVSDKMYLNPFLFDRYTENPFKTENRQYPVDFTTPLERRMNLILKLPEGWAVEELPKSTRMTLPTKDASISFTSVSDDKTINIAYKLMINKPVFVQTEYNDLKVFFDQLVKKQAEMIVIKKI
ncbi:MAG: hypothetical protein ACOYM7_01115 [Paludibacter sp.]